MVSQYMELGGPLMWPLLACSILLGAVLLERVWTVLIRHRLFRGRVPVDRLTWHHRSLLFFTDVPPSLGLLGTVIGVVKSFNVLDGKIDADAVGAGLGIACITTIFGLGLAILASASRYGLDWAVGRNQGPEEAGP